MATSPRVKRAFAGAASDPSQRHITSLFGREDGVEQTEEEGGDSSMPCLPAMVQANLLSVGMRVRKSVPEGYKTGEEDEESDAFFSSSARRHHVRPVGYADLSSVQPTTSRELLPFCGLHKVGGQSLQSFPGDGDDDDHHRPLFPASMFGDIDDNESEPPSLTSSQSTIGSDTPFTTPSRPANSFTASPATPSPITPPVFARKRALDEAEDVDDDDDDNDNLGVHNTQISDPFAACGPRSARSQAASSLFSPTSWLSQGTRNAPNAPNAPASPLAFYQSGRRVLAVPRRRQSKQQQQPASAKVHIVDQENVVSNDFDEAEFLDASVWGQRQAGDEEMGGM